jgi:hypothetical protein
MKKNSPSRIELRKSVVEKVRIEYAKRTPKEQLGLMNYKLGLNVGGSRERAKLRLLIDNKLGDVSFADIVDRLSSKNAKNAKKVAE